MKPRNKIICSTEAALWPEGVIIDQKIPSFNAWVITLLTCLLLTSCARSDHWYFGSESRPMDKVMINKMEWANVEDTSKVQQPGQCPIDIPGQGDSQGFVKDAVSKVILDENRKLLSEKKLSELGFNCGLTFSHICTYQEVVIIRRSGFGDLTLNGNHQIIITICIDQSKIPVTPVIVQASAPLGDGHGH